MRKQLLFQLIGCVIILFLVHDLDFSYVKQSFRDVETFSLFISLLLLWLASFCKVARWRTLLAIQGLNYPVRSAARVFTIGQFFAVITPGRIGDLVKIFYLEKETPLTHFKALANVVIDRAFDLVALVLLAVIFSAREVLSPTQSRSLIALAAGILALLAIFSHSKSAHAIFSVLEQIPVLRRLMNRKSEFIAECLSLLHRLASRRLAIPIFFTAAAYVLLILHAYYLALALRIHSSVMDIALILTLASIAALLPFSIGGVGPREAAMKHLFVGVLGGGAAAGSVVTEKLAAQGVAFSLAYHFVFAFTLGLGGFFLWLRSPISFDSFTRLSSRIFQNPKRVSPDKSTPLEIPK